MPGDPLRAKFIAETFLENARLVNNVRGIHGYTGVYKETPVSVMRGHVLREKSHVLSRRAAPRKTGGGLNILRAGVGDNFTHFNGNL